MPPASSSAFSYKVAMVILNWNGKADTLACLQSLEQMVDADYLPIVVDNASTDGSVAAIRERYPSVHLIENSRNLGFAEGNNVGIRYALTTAASFILLLNNDTLVDPHFLKALMTRFAQKPSIDILGAKLYRQASFPPTLDHWGGRWNPNTARFDLLGQGDKEPMTPPDRIDYVCGAALIAPRSIWKTVGLLESQFFLIWEEADWCARAQRCGYHVSLCPDAIVWHKVSASFKSKTHSTYFWWRNRLLWMSRNLPRKERLRLYRQVVGPEIAHLLKLYLLKSGQLWMRKKVSPTRCWDEHETKLRQTRAALHGVYDYLRGKGGNAPAWVYRK